MAAPRPGFDPSLNPGSPGAIESSNTTAVAAKHAKPTKPEELTAKGSLAQGDKKAPPAPPSNGGLPDGPKKPELSPKEAAAAEAKKPVVEKKP